MLTMPHNSGTQLRNFTDLKRSGQLNEEISKLIDLQVIDSEIDGFDGEIEAKEQEVIIREQSIADKDAGIERCKEQTLEFEQQQRDLKTETEDAQTRVKDRQNKMMQVQTSREHQALLKEIEENKRLVKTNEERLLQIMEQVEQLEKDATELENLCAGEKELLTGETEDVKKAVGKITTRKRKVLKKRKDLVPDLKAGTLKRYDILREKRNGKAVVQTKNGVCQGCFMTIPPQQANEVRKGEKLNFCPTCQRVLYYMEDQESVDA